MGCIELGIHMRYPDSIDIKLTYMKILRSENRNIFYELVCNVKKNINHTLIRFH